MRRNIVTWGKYVAKQSSELYFNESAQGIVRTIDYGDYDVFISHKGDDMKLAEAVGDLLKSRSVSSYLDRWDPNVSGDSADLEIYLREVIRNVPNILAVVTENTPLSWWVPFEIGVARETDSQVATFLTVNENSRVKVSLPSYLRTWPILVDASELGEWADDVASPRRMPYSARTSYFEKASQPTGIDRLVELNKVEFI